MSKYDVPFSLVPATGWKTVVALTAAAARTLYGLRLDATDEQAASTDSGVAVRVLTAASISGGTAGATPTPTPLGNAGAAGFTAQTNFSGEPTITTQVTKMEPRVIPAGAGLTVPFDDAEQEVKVFGTGVILVQVKSAAARTYPTTGVLQVKE